MAGVRFPEMRRNGWDALGGLAEQLPASDYYGNLDNAINVAADNFDPPDRLLGASLVDDAEVGVLKRLWAAWEEVVREAGSRTLPDDDVYRATRAWPLLVAVATEARELLKRNGL
jgi:hypothetical protein